MRCLLAALVTVAATQAAAEDWPEWRGSGRLGVVAAEDVVDVLPDGGLPEAWSAAIGGGYAGPAVADGRVFVTDFRAASDRPGERLRGTERIVVLDETTGEVFWQRSWPAHYRGLEPRYALGPRATPTVDGDRVYALGAMGHLGAFEVVTGTPLWHKDLVADYGTDVPVWGMSGAPIVDGDRLIVVAGGDEGALVVAFDKRTGAERWRALDTGDEPGYGQPVLIEAGGTTQLIVWHPGFVSSLDPATGRVWWQVPKAVNLGLTVATPVFDGRHLLVSSFFRGSTLMALDDETPAARMLWRGKSASEIDTDGLHALIGTPVIDGDTIYGVGSYGQLRALDLATGERLWETLDAVGEKARWASAFIVANGDRYLLSNDRGELILADLRRDGYRELGRVPLIEPTSPASRRSLGAVHWSHPAYANGHIVVRNDREILRAGLRSAPSDEPDGDGKASR